MLRMQLLGTAPWFSRSPACRHVRRGVCKAFKVSGVQFGSGPRGGSESEMKTE